MYDRMKDPQHIKWAKTIKSRDDYTCQVCGATGKYLNSHHLNAVCTHPEEIFLIENGVCLDQDCHDLLHKIFGFATTEEQFEEFRQMIEMIKEIVQDGYK